MFVYISVWGVVLAALSAMVIGTLWYSPLLFGKPWMKAIGLSEKEMKNRSKTAILTLIAVSLITAYILAHFIVFTNYYFGGSPVVIGLVTALWAWLGFAATTVVAHGIFEPRRKIVMLINVGNRLVTLLVMGAVIGAFM